MKITKEVIDYFVRSFRITKSPRPLATLDAKLEQVKVLQTNFADGVRLDMANEDFDELVEFALEGRMHREFRALHPGAKDAYDNYMTMYMLTRKYDVT